MTSRKAIFHILSQFLWPDDAPTGIYSEQLADGIGARGREVRLVTGAGTYRPGARERPATPIERLSHHVGRRESLASTLVEYLAVGRAFRKYVERTVRAGDVVIVTSAPPTTIFLHSSIRRRGAVSVYWLHDYYPQLVRGIWDPPKLATRALSTFWNRHLARWDHVVKVASNIGYFGRNVRVIRNWPTLEIPDLGPPRPSTALYSGNLGYGHDLDRFIELCRDLRNRGYTIRVRADGPKIRKLPDWISVVRPCVRPEDLVVAYEEAEVHLIAGDPKMPEAVFPSKIWNSLAAGRRVMASGFAGPMQQELALTLEADFRTHLPQWIDFVLSLEGS